MPLEFLTTTQNQLVEIINPGEYNREGGPDFRRATLRLAGKIVQGDIEIHLDPRDWYTHGHHLDPAYNGVILHLALFLPKPPAAAGNIFRENGLPVPQVLLPAAALASPPAEDVLLFHCPLSLQAPEKIQATVQQAGKERLAAKAGAFAEQLAQASWDQVIYRGMAEALGYEKNQETFRRLTDIVPIDLLLAELRDARIITPEILVEALLFGAAGFLAPVPNLGAGAAFVTPRWRVWEEKRHTLQIRPLRRENWLFFRLRPANFPSRRLAALCALVLKFARGGILEQALGMVAAHGKERKRLVRVLLQHLYCPAGEFWQWHYDLHTPPSKVNRPRGDLLGRERALDIIVNILLPVLWLYYREAGNSVLQNQVQEAYAALPKLQENQISRRMRQQLSAARPLPAQTGAGARDQQGLVHLHKLYCRPRRCQECLQLSETKAADPPMDNP